jgi:hypothetical protein
MGSLQSKYVSFKAGTRRFKVPPWLASMRGCLLKVFRNPGLEFSATIKLGLVVAHQGEWTPNLHSEPTTPTRQTAQTGSSTSDWMKRWKVVGLILAGTLWTTLITLPVAARRHLPKMVVHPSAAAAQPGVFYLGTRYTLFLLSHS